jgi:beta-galactosidase
MSGKLLYILSIVSIIFFSCTRTDVPSGIEIKGVKNPEITLNGQWKFSMNPPANFWENNIDFSGWRDILVPGECQMQGFAIKHDTTYVYKLEFSIPEDYSEKQTFIDFSGVYSYTRVWVNGQFIRDHHGGFTKWRCDITSHIKPGDKAILTVEITDRTDDISYGSGYAKHQIGGILGDVKLLALPFQNFNKLYFETDLDENFTDAELKIYYALNLEYASSIKVEVYNEKDILEGSMEQENPDQSGVLSMIIKNPLKWDAEHPNLYTVVISLWESGIEVLRVPKETGFREIMISGNKMLINGRQVKLRGACRHNIHPVLGRMTTPEYDERDVLLAKEANMNFIRTSHYPPSEAFLSFCDKYGIYVEDETAVCFVGSHRTADYRASGTSQNSSEYTDRYLSQLEEMVQNHRSHPCIIIWSIGNENAFGSNFRESYKWVKANDPTRPVIFSYPGQVPDSLPLFDIVSMHYPDWKGNLEQYGIKSEKFSCKSMPMLFDEWAHVPCYNNATLKYDPNVRSFWGQSLDSMWTNLFESDGGLGGAIWGMIDETFMLPDTLAGFNKWWGKIDPEVIPSTYTGPCVGYGEWGIIDTWRRKKPEFNGTKKAYSPAKVLIKQIKDFTPDKDINVPVHNRFDHTNFNELTINWRYGKNSGEIKNLNIGPHQKGQLTIPGQPWQVGNKLALYFYQNDTLLIDQYNLTIGEKVSEIPKCKKGKLKVSDREENVSIEGKDYSLTLNKKSGLINDLIVKNDTLIKSGPYINLKIKGQSNSIIDYAQNWKCTGFEYEIKDGIATITTKGVYDRVTSNFRIEVDQEGLICIDYKINHAPEGEEIHETGIKFITGNQFSNIEWNRKTYFTSYPESDPGREEGVVNLNIKPVMEYRKYPDHKWGMDIKEFYYYGKIIELPLTKAARSTKENIYFYTLTTPDNHFIKVIDNSTQACRFDKIDSSYVLTVSLEWDYPSLLWGNYYKSIKVRKEMGGRIVLSSD